MHPFCISPHPASTSETRTDSGQRIIAGHSRLKLATRICAQPSLIDTSAGATTTQAGLQKQLQNIPGTSKVFLICTVAARIVGPSV
jgi:ribulose kinase